MLTYRSTYLLGDGEEKTETNKYFHVLWSFFLMPSYNQFTKTYKNITIYPQQNQICLFMGGLGISAFTFLPILEKKT